MKKILGLDLGTNSIGWALVESNSSETTHENWKGNILGMGSRIIPMSQEIMGDFEKGNSVSQTAERTHYRGVRRLRERELLRRERLHRVLNVLGFLPEHYSSQIDFERCFGKFKRESEPKLAYKFNEETKRFEFVFQKSFQEMIADFSVHQPELVAGGKKVPFDWTLYYLRKKALSKKIEKEELAWLLLNFNQKRGYYQLRGEDEVDEGMKDKSIEFHSLKVLDVIEMNEQNAKKQSLYKIKLENGWEFVKPSNIPVLWKDKVKDFIITTTIDKNGNEKRSFRAPDENDWTLLKKKTENAIENSKKTVGSYIFDTLLKQPNQKIKGKLVRTIERYYYKKELYAILEKQSTFHPELNSKDAYADCINELYPNNESHRGNIKNKDFTYLFIEDILFYQRPLKSKKSSISNCRYEKRIHKDKDGNWVWEPLKCIAKSHPLFQEFRLWQWMKNLKISETEGGLDITANLLSSDEDYLKLFNWLNDRKEVEQKHLFKYFKLNEKFHRWNFVLDKKYPCNETRSLIKGRLDKCQNVPKDFLTREKEISLWHILYSVEDKYEIEKALNTFARKNNLGIDFVEQFKKCPQLEKAYGSYSEKAIKKLLPLMRIGKYWNSEDIWPKVPTYKLNLDGISARIRSKAIETNDEYHKTINTKLLSELENLNDDLDSYKDLPLHIASYAVYGRHSEEGEIKKWETSNDISNFLDPSQEGGFKQHSLRNPIVEQIVTETLRVVKDIWVQFGQGQPDFFSEIHVELGREMKLPADERKRMTENISKNETTNLRIKALLAELKNDKNIENVRPYSPSQQEILKIYEEGVINSVNEIPEEILKIQKSNQPTQSELIRYKLWLEQGYISPYTREIIPLNKLFTSAYEIEHIIPQSRFFDDSLSNKVICEAEVNRMKGNMLGLEFIKEFGSQQIELNFGKKVTILTEEEYLNHITKYFASNKAKQSKLKLEEIPEKMVERQMNDTRYISKVIKNLLSNIVREEGEMETTSKNVIPTSGNITSILRQDWGLNDVWNEIIMPRFERLNNLTNSQNFTSYSEKHQKSIPNLPLELQKGFQKKRIDHRHHALDALVIALATRSHINYLNNVNATEKKSKELKQQKREDLKRLLCFKKFEDVSNNKYQWVFYKPWPTLTKDCKDRLNSTIISFKQNTRILNKTKNRYLKWIEIEGKKAKGFEMQTGGANWAIRKPLHKETVYGKVSLLLKKSVSIAVALDNWESIADKSLKLKIKDLVGEGLDKKRVLKFFKDLNLKWNNKDISKIEIYYIDRNNVASSENLNETFNQKRIESITDTGIQKILGKHLEKYNELKGDKIIEHPELAFSPDGIELMNSNIVELNNGKNHQPIFKVRTYESKGNKFAVGEKGNKKDKFVVAAKGTNLFFGVYQKNQGGRSFETIPLNVVIERLKQGFSEVPETNADGDRLLFHLSPNDLVYVPKEEEMDSINNIDFNNLSPEQVGRVYKMVSSTEKECHFVPSSIASLILSYDSKTKLGELGSLNKLETTIEITGSSRIKESCIKLFVDRLGKIKSYRNNSPNYNSRNQTSIIVSDFNPKYNLPISFSTTEKLEEDELEFTKTLSPEQRFAYLNELRKATHNLTLSEEEKKEILNRIIINPPNGH